MNYIAAILLVLLIGIGYMGPVHAEGPEHPVGVDLTCTWAAAVDRVDGQPLEGQISYDVYYGTDQNNMTLVASGVTETSYAGITAARGQNWCGVVTVETTELTEGPSRMEFGPFVGVLVPTARPNAPGMVNVIRTP